MAIPYQFDIGGYIRSQVLVNETLVLSENDCHGLIDSTFAAGTLRLAQSKYGPVIVRSTVKDSDVIAVKRQREYRLFSARFINCRFHGVFSSIDFGQSPTPEPDGDFGGVKDCDFTHATLDSCRFINVDVSNLQFPRRDHAVLLEPYKRAADVPSVEWPGLLGLYMEACTERPESFKALVMHIPSLARLVHCTKEDVRAALEKFGGVLM